MNQGKNYKKIVYHVVLYGFALIGFIFVAVFIALRLGLLNVKGASSERNKYFNLNSANVLSAISSDDKYIKSDWMNSGEWYLMKHVFIRDQEIIKKAAKDSGVDARIILGGVMGEQFRFFSNRRESFKNYFEPMKILASLSNVSFGIAGLKPKTLNQIESNLSNIHSPFYLGPEMENVISYESGDDIESVQMSRITDTKNPYYSYLYVGLFMRQIHSQWLNAGFDLSDKPGIYATLYNLGFYYSRPKADPRIGGSVIIINGHEYTFGDIAHEFYFSEELIDVFPVPRK
jgi:hypothetical protein